MKCTRAVGRTGGSRATRGRVLHVRLGVVLDRLKAREPWTDTIIRVNYHEEDEDVPPGADMQIDWPTRLGRELDDDDKLEFWVHVDCDGWQVMRVEGPGDLTAVARLSLTAEADPSVVADQLADILAGQHSFSAENRPAG